MYVSVTNDTPYPCFAKSFNLLLNLAHVSASLVSGTFSICRVLTGSNGNLSPPNLQCMHVMNLASRLQMHTLNM